MNEIRRWYRKEVPPHKNQDNSSSLLMGPVTMLRGLQRMVSAECPQSNLMEHNPELEWVCGPDVIRLYEEKAIVCKNTSTAECPLVRWSAPFVGARFGLFAPGPERLIIGWSRFSGCDAWGCHAGGKDLTSVTLAP